MSRPCDVLHHVKTRQQFVQPLRMCVSSVLDVDIDVTANKNRARERDKHLEHR